MFSLSSYTSSIDKSVPSSRAMAQAGRDEIRYLDKVLIMIEEKIMRLGVGLQEYYCVCAIRGLFEKIGSSGQSRTEEKQAADRMTLWVQKILSMQDNHSSLPTMVRTRHQACYESS